MKRQKVVKLNGAALRSLIKEAIQTREPGSPLFTPPNDQSTSPMLNDSISLSKRMSDLFYESAMEMYDPGDPSTEAAGGRDGWERQVARATDDFETRVEDLVRELQDQLVDGQHY